MLFKICNELFFFFPQMFASIWNAKLLTVSEVLINTMHNIITLFHFYIITLLDCFFIEKKSEDICSRKKNGKSIFGVYSLICFYLLVGRQIKNLSRNIIATEDVSKRKRKTNRNFYLTLKQMSTTFFCYFF